MQHIATHYTTLQHNTTHCNTLHHSATQCNALQHTCRERGLSTTFGWSRSALASNSENAETIACENKCIYICVYICMSKETFVYTEWPQKKNHLWYRKNTKTIACEKKNVHIYISICICQKRRLYMLSDLKKRLIYNIEKMLRRLPVKKKKNMYPAEKSIRNICICQKRWVLTKHTHLFWQIYIYICQKRCGYINRDLEERPTYYTANTLRWLPVKKWIRNIYICQKRCAFTNRALEDRPAY